MAIGELAAGLQIDLDKVPKKYAGLDGTEIAISESQERMAVVIAPENVEQFLAYAASENLEATPVAVVTEDPRLVMSWRGKEIVNISRAFLDTNGAHQETTVTVAPPAAKDNYFAKKVPADIAETWKHMLSDLNVCSQKGLVERFDASIGAGSVTMPYGGQYQTTETQAMIAKLPVQNGHTDCVTMMAYGFDPYLSSWSPYHGASFAVVDSVAKITASGGDWTKIRMTFQEYFRRMTEDPHTWGLPFAALLGAYEAQIGFGLPSIGGKDSMSGSFGEKNVPPTLVSFAVNVGDRHTVVTPELKHPGSRLVLFAVPRTAEECPDYAALADEFSVVRDNIRAGRVLSAWALGAYGVAEAVSKMAFGNRLGVHLDDSALEEEELFAPAYGAILAEVPADKVAELAGNGRLIGTVIAEPVFLYADVKLDLAEAEKLWEKPLSGVFPTDSGEKQKASEAPLYHAEAPYINQHKVAKPHVFIPVFPGTNCEYDSARAFERAGAIADVRVFKNLSASDILESAEEFAKCVRNAQIVMFPGGFSAGDEPEGSAKFFATAFRSQVMKEAIDDLLQQRDGLMLGICNGFQALIKLGLVPYGTVRTQEADSPTLTYNTIGRHISHMAYLKVVSDKSPWLAGAELGGVYVNPISHGEGRFVASDEWLQKLFANGQVATQYVDPAGRPGSDEIWNPNGSYCAIEGITSPDGRVYGKMAHSERIGESVAVNITGNQDLKLFESGVRYFG